MSYLSTKKPSPVAMLGLAFMTLGTVLPDSAAAFAPTPLFKEVNRYETIITTNGDPAEVYYPVPSNDNNNTEKFPVALLLQGALVDKSDYSNFSKQVASYGFVVVVPNHERTLTDPQGQPITGFLAEQQQVNDVLTYIEKENSNSSSPVAGLLNTNKLGLLGHSFGGFVGLSAIQNICYPGVCSKDFTKPEALMAGIFYGTTFRDPPAVGKFPPIDNQGIPTALVAGSRDGVAELFEVEGTFKQIQEPPRALVTVEGANHYGITNEDNPERDPTRPTLDQTVATETIARWSALFLRAHLLEDKEAFDYFYKTGDAFDKNVSVTSETKSIPEPVSVLGILAFGTLGAGAMLKRSKKKIKSTHRVVN